MVEDYCSVTLVVSLNPFMFESRLLRLCRCLVVYSKYSNGYKGIEGTQK